MITLRNLKIKKSELSKPILFGLCVLKWAITCWLNAVGDLENEFINKEQMKQDIIPTVWQMAEKEKEHLNWLIDNNAPKDMIETSQRYLSHFRQRHKEYIEQKLNKITELD
jgi:hypothetical protein